MLKYNEKPKAPPRPKARRNKQDESKRDTIPAPSSNKVKKSEAETIPPPPGGFWK